MTHEETRIFGAELAAKDYRNHIEHGVDLNPFSTACVRDLWQRGYDNVGSRFSIINIDFNLVYWRGRAAAEIMELNEEKK